MITVEKDDKKFEITYLEHMLHFKNLESVLSNGLLSHNEAYRRELIKEDISMSEVQDRRHQKRFTINGKQIGIHDLVSFYFNSRNPMLYRRRNVQPELLILLISADILDSNTNNSQFAIFSDGNAGSSATNFFVGKGNLINVDLNLIYSNSWNHDDADIKRENVRRMCSEALVYPSVSVSAIEKIICPNQIMYDLAEGVKTKLGNSVSHITIEINHGYFF